MNPIFVVIYAAFLVLGFRFTAVEGRVRGFFVYLILALIGAVILFSLTCEGEVFFVGKIPICRE